MIYLPRTTKVVKLWIIGINVEMEKLSIYVNKRTATAECGCNGGGGSYSWANAKKKSNVLFDLWNVQIIEINVCMFIYGK